MNYSPYLVEAVKRFEGCSLMAYPDATGWSIGYGHFGATEGQTITQELADSYLQLDLQAAEQAVNSLVTRTLSQRQFDALCDFVFNLGMYTFMHSRLLYFVNQNEDSAVDHDFIHFVYSGGKVSAALVERRTWEADMYSGVA